MGYHDAFDSSAHASFQNGAESWPLEVDSGSDVGNDLVIGKPGPQEIFLPFKITSLFRRRDSRVGDVRLGAGATARAITVADDSIPSVTSRGLSMLNVPPIRPVPKCLFGNAKVFDSCAKAALSKILARLKWPMTVDGSNLRRLLQVLHVLSLVGAGAQTCDSASTVWYAPSGRCEPCGGTDQLCCKAGGQGACRAGLGLSCAVRTDPSGTDSVSSVYGLAYVCVRTGQQITQTATPANTDVAANDSVLVDQSFDPDAPRRVHKETGLMQWRDSPPASVPAAKHWPMQFDRMLGLSLFFYEQQRMGALPPDTRAPWRADSLKKEGGGWLDGDTFRCGYADAGDFLKFMLPGAHSIARLAWATHRYKGRLRRTHFDGTNNYRWAREAVKWGTDFLARAVENDRILLHQGDIDADHGYIGLSELYPDFDRTPVFCESGACSDVAGATAAALAHGALAFKDRKRVSSKYWSKAKSAYAQTNVGGSLTNSNDVFAPLKIYYTSSGVASHVFFAAASMYAACKGLDACGDDEAARYKADADAMGAAKEPDGNAKWFWPASSWDNAWFDAAVLMAAQGDDGPEVYGQPAYRAFLADFANRWVTGADPVAVSPRGQRWVNAWASMRYSLNGAAVLLLWSELDDGFAAAAKVSPQQARCAAVRQILYAGGMNDRGSYIAGFGDAPVQRNHHRSSVCAPWEQQDSDDNSCAKLFTDVVDPRGSCPTFEDESAGICYVSANRPNKWMTAGALVGGPKSADDAGDQERSPYADEGWRDFRTDYVGSEQALDYNAGFTLALASTLALPESFWTDGCEGVDDFSESLGKAQADKPHVEERFSDSDVYTFADFEKYGYTRSLDRDWFWKGPYAY